MKLTPEEKQLILDKRKHEEDSKPKTFGVLKENLYYLCLNRPVLEYDILDVIEEQGYFLNKKQIQKMLDDMYQNLQNRLLKNNDVVVCLKGTKFVCYNDTGEEEWHDDANVGIEGMGKEWAEKYLTITNK